MYSRNVLTLSWSPTKTGEAASIVWGCREENGDKSASSTGQLTAKNRALSQCPWNAQFHLDVGWGLKFKVRSGLKERLCPSTWISRIQSDTQTSHLVTARHSWHDSWMSHFQNFQVCEVHCFIFILIFFFFSARKASWCCSSCKNMINIQSLIDPNFYRWQWTGCFVLSLQLRTQGKNVI